MVTVYNTVFVLFCDIVDNFGDAGSCFRLARALKKEEQKELLSIQIMQKFFL